MIAHRRCAVQPVSEIDLSILRKQISKIHYYRVWVEYSYIFVARKLSRAIEYWIWHNKLASCLFHRKMAVGRSRVFFHACEKFRTKLLFQHIFFLLHLMHSIPRCLININFAKLFESNEVNKLPTSSASSEQRKNCRCSQRPSHCERFHIDKSFVFEVDGNFRPTIFVTIYVGASAFMT